MTKPTWTPHPEVTKRQQVEASEKSEGLALEILRIAAQSPGTPVEIATRAEVYWQWVTTDAWQGGK